MKIYLVGIGMGNDKTITQRAKEIIDKCSVIIGAKRMTSIITNFENKEIFNSYKADEIKEFIDKFKDKNKNIVILLSGDVGFYSGAKKLLASLKNYDTELISGISSVVYFCSKLKKSWEDCILLSLHGKNENIIGFIRQNKKVFAILSGREDLKNLCEKLMYYNMENVVLNIGQRLSYQDEKIITKKVNEITDFDFDNLIVVLAENNDAKDLRNIYINDDEFIRGDIPMTKSEVRSLSIAKLCLNENSILYDIGAGTGSISIEAALKLTKGKVFAIEKNEKGIELINKNKQKFATDNVEIICGKAPEIFEKLTVPTHAFIGGSSGNMNEIIDKLFKINPEIKIVINAISLNTIAEIENIISSGKFNYDISCVNVSKNKTVGSYRLMQAQNPVYIIEIYRR